MPEENWRTVACKVALVTAIMAVSFGAFVPAGQMVIDRYLQVNLLVFWRILTLVQILRPVHAHKISTSSGLYPGRT